MDLGSWVQVLFSTQRSVWAGYPDTWRSWFQFFRHLYIFVFWSCSEALIFFFFFSSSLPYNWMWYAVEERQDMLCWPCGSLCHPETKWLMPHSMTARREESIYGQTHRVGKRRQVLSMGQSWGEFLLQLWTEGWKLSFGSFRSSRSGDTSCPQCHSPPKCL